MNTISINADLAWTETSWIYNGLLRRLAEELGESDPDLSIRLRAAQKDLDLIDPDLYKRLLRSDWYTAVSYCNLEELTENRFRMLMTAATRVYGNVARSGPKQFTDPRAYPSFLLAISEFKAKLLLDPRAKLPAQDTGLMVVNDQVEWIAPGWVFDLVLEDLATFAVERDTVLAQDLWDARLCEGGGYLDLRIFHSKRFCELLPGLKWLYGFYVTLYITCRLEGKRLQSFDSELMPHVLDLKVKFDSDPRIGEDL